MESIKKCLICKYRTTGIACSGCENYDEFVIDPDILEFGESIRQSERVKVLREVAEQIMSNDQIDIDIEAGIVDSSEWNSLTEYGKEAAKACMKAGAKWFRYIILNIPGFSEAVKGGENG